MDWDTMVSHLCFVAAFTCMYWLGYSMLLSLCAALLAFFVLVFVLEVCKMTLPNFLSSIRIRATKPFILNDWIKTNIEGYEVSGTVKHVGWWWTTVTAEDGGTLFIPNHKFTDNIVDNIVRNPSHWCIKIYIPISPLGVNKIDSIVADMRQVLAKNPQVEQKTVFLEVIHPEKQDLKILISCFVETSHYEEYLSVKHAIILDLLEVVDHHQAWLAATNRTVDGPLCRNDCTSNWYKLQG